MAHTVRRHDVVVVGAGLSGLVAATRLWWWGADVVAIEAAAEVGGRTRSRTLSGRTVDVGGELVGRDYTRLRGLVAAVLGLERANLGADGIAHAWHEEPYIGGGYPAFALGRLTRNGPALRAAHDRVHFAGADRGTWPGTMEGAVRDGNRVAAEIRTRLG